MSYITTIVVLSEDDEIESHTSKSALGDREVVRLKFEGGDLSLMLVSREQAERLFDAVSEATMRWREREPAVRTGGTQP